MAGIPGPCVGVWGCDGVMDSHSGASQLSIPPPEASTNLLNFPGKFSFVVSAREKNKARAVVEIYLSRGRCPLGLYPSDATNRK